MLKQKHTIHHWMRNPHRLKVRRCTTCLVDHNEYFALFPGSMIADKIVWLRWMKFCLTVFPTVGASKCMYRDLIANILLKQNMLTGLNTCIYHNIFMKV